MKKIVTIVLVLALLVVVAPWGIGKLAEKRINAGLDKLVEQAPYLTIVERKWTGGWFRSEQEVTVEVFKGWQDAFKELAALEKATAAASQDGEQVETAADATQPETQTDAPAAPDAAAPAESPLPIPPLRFAVRNEILHGPVLWPASVGIARVNTKLVLSEDIQKKIDEVFGKEELVRMSTRIGFFGGATTTFAGDGRSIKFKDTQKTLAYDDYKLDVGYSKNMDDIDAKGKWPRFEVTDPAKGVIFQIKDMKLTSSSERVRGDLYVGDFDFAVDEIRIVDEDKSVTSIADLRYGVGMKMDGDFMNWTIKVGSGKVKNKALEQIKFDLNEIHYDFSVRRLHAETLEKLFADIKKSYTPGALEHTSTDSGEAAAAASSEAAAAGPLMPVYAIDKAMDEAFKKYGVELLKYDPEFVLDRIGIVTPEGEGVLKGVVRLKGVTADDLSAGSMSLIGKIDADVTITVAQKMLEKIPGGNTGAGAAIDGGYAKRDGDNLVSHIEFKAGALKINGKDQAIPGLGGPGPEAGGPPPVATPQE